MSNIKSLALINGDLVIENDELQMVDGDELLRQKVQEVISTNKGEWFTDWEQGITFSNILGKNVERDTVRSEIEAGIRQVDPDLTISRFSVETIGRKLKVEFTAIRNDVEIEFSEEY